MAKTILIEIIHLYKRFISPLLLPSCRFHPSCSEYASGAVETHGVIYGLMLGVRRVLKCNPLHPGGLDPVPPKRGVTTMKGIYNR